MIGKAITGTVEVKTNCYQVGKFWQNDESGRDGHKVFGWFDNVEDAVECISNHLPQTLPCYLDDRFFVTKELFDNIAAIYPQLMTMVERRELSSDAYEIEYRQWHKMPLLTPDQRVQIADLCGYTFTGDDGSSQYYIHRTANVPVEVIK